MGLLASASYVQFLRYDMAAASLFVLNLPEKIYEKYEPMLSHINVGTGADIYRYPRIYRHTIPHPYQLQFLSKHWCLGQNTLINIGGPNR